MNSAIPEHLQTTDGFVHAAFEAFDAELESQLGIKVDDFKEVYDAAAEELESASRMERARSTLSMIFAIRSV